MGNKSKNTLLATAIGFLVGGGIHPAMAQDDGSARVIEEIMVTARKREESLSDVPVAISAFTSTAIEASGIDEIGDVLNNTVGMVYNERDGNRAQAQPGVRGIKSFTGGGAARVSTFIDGMPVAGSQSTIQFVDVESVEVYRGPQSAVFGRAVFAGAINYTYRQPSLDEQTGAVNLQIGQDGRQALNGFYTTPLIEDVLGLYVSAATDSYDGPGGATSNDGYKLGNRDTKHFNIALKYQPTDQLSTTLRYTSTELDDGPAPDYNLAPYNAVGNPDGDQNYQQTAAQEANNGAPLYAGKLNYLDDPVFRRNFCYNEGEADQNCTKDPGWELERERLAFDVNYDFDNGHTLTFKAFTSEDSTFDHDDQDNTDSAPMGIVHMGTETEIEEDYYELIWTSPSEDQLRFTLGYSNYEYSSNSDAWFTHPSATLTGEGAGLSVTSTDVENTGLFGGVFYDVTEKMTVSFEGRQQSDDISALDPDPTDEFVPEAKSDTFLPRLSVNYALSDEVNVYAQYSQGVQPATVNSGAVATQQRAIAVALGEIGYEDATPFLDGLVSVEEEVLDSFEIGMKGTFLEGRMSINAALFMIETDGYVETQNMFFYPEGSVATTVQAELEAYGLANDIPELAGLGNTSVRVRGGVNTADVTSKGIELEGTYLLGDNWELSGQFTYLKAEFDNGCVPIGADFGIDNSTLTLPGGVEVPCTTVDGNAFPFTPELQLGLAVSYTDELSNGMEWFTRLDMRYEDEQYMDWFESGYLPDSTKFNLRAGITTGNFRIEAYVENLTDDDTPLGAQYEPGRAEVTSATGLVGPAAVGLNVAAAYPREVGLKIGYSF